MAHIGVGDCRLIQVCIDERRVGQIGEKKAGEAQGGTVQSLPTAGGGVVVGAAAQVMFPLWSKPVTSSTCVPAPSSFGESPG